VRTPNTLRQLAIEGEHGRYWYRLVHQALVDLCTNEGYPLVHTAAILGVTSPRIQVPRNARKTIEYMSAWTRNGGRIDTHLSVDGLMNQIRKSLEKYERTGAITGPKTEPFAAACLGDEDAVVLDIWMAKALQVRQESLGSKRIHREACKRVRTTARQLGWTPAQTQAAIWTAMYERAHIQPAPGLDVYLRR